MRRSRSKGLTSFIGILIGMGLGQVISFALVAGETWMIVDKLLFGVGIGVGLSAVANAVLKRLVRHTE
jgi:hypothetical protein